MNIPRNIPQQVPIDPLAPEILGADPEPAYIFNPSDLPQYDDNQPISQFLLEEELSNYVSEVGGSVVLGDITIGSSGGLVFDYSGDRQIRAFSEDRNTTINNIADKTQYMTIDHGVTKVP